MATSEPIRAAGVVLIRSRRGKPEVLAVHRPSRRDWSIPKGKLEPGEHWASAAVRECLEETGYLASLGAPLPLLRYLVQGRPKTVHYWVGRVRHDSGFAPTQEVDEVRWLPPSDAAELLTYEHDHDLVNAASAMPATVPFIVLRHTQAVKRADFSGSSDQDRPLTPTGLFDAEQLVPLLDAYGVTQVHSSDALRCQQTAAPFAHWLTRAVHPEPTLSEIGFSADPQAGRDRIRELFQLNQPIVICTHRPVLPELISVLSQQAGMSELNDSITPALKPGGMIVVHRAFTGPQPTAIAAEVHQWPGA